jgi:hypothetical protein
MTGAAIAYSWMGVALYMCRAIFIAGFALIFFGFVTLLSDLVQRQSWAFTTIGDVLDAIDWFYFHRMSLENTSELLRYLILLPFSYAAVAIGVFASIVGIVCSRT